MSDQDTLPVVAVISHGCVSVCVCVPLDTFRSKSALKMQGSGTLGRTDSVLTTASSAASLTSMGSLSSMPSSLSRTPSVTFNLPSLSRTPSVTFNLPGRTTPGAADNTTAAAAAGRAAAAREEVQKATPFASLGAAQAVAHHQQQEGGVEAAGTRKEPELVGFVLLDPLWEENEEVGYVSSIVRMKRTAHQGARVMQGFRQVL